MTIKRGNDEKTNLLNNLSMKIRMYLRNFVACYAEFS